jgi:hypothetical protein
VDTCFGLAKLIGGLRVSILAPRVAEGQDRGERRLTMELVLVLIILFLLFGGGFSFYRRGR